MQDDIEELKKENKNSIKIKSPEESLKIKISEESAEIKSLKKDENTTDWYDKNNFKKILAIADSKKFSHKYKISNFKYNVVNNLINNIRNNTIREILAKKI